MMQRFGHYGDIFSGPTGRCFFNARCSSVLGQKAAINAVKLVFKPGLWSCTIYSLEL